MSKNIENGHPYTQFEAENETSTTLLSTRSQLTTLRLEGPFYIDKMAKMSETSKIVIYRLKLKLRMILVQQCYLKGSNCITWAIMVISYENGKNINRYQKLTYIGSN